MRIGFITCVQLGRECIERVHALGGKFAYMGSLHDELARTKSGRVWIQDLAEHDGLELHKFRNINDDDAIAGIRAADLDWLFIVGWSQIARAELLETPRMGVLGMHPTLLPAGRGRASIPWAILKGLDETGVTLFKLDDGVDTGPIVHQVRIPVQERETATTLYAKVQASHSTLMEEAWLRLASGSLDLRIQDDSMATVWPGRTPADGALDARMSALEVDRLVRATTRPYPGAFLPDGQRVVRIWAGHPRVDEACTDGLQISFADGAYCAHDYEYEAAQ
jgi:methionyl-tRNA formyltransferase